MPNYFTLTRKGEAEPVDLVKLDAELCAHLGAQCDPKRWVAGWHDSVGLMLALGKSLDDIRSVYDGSGKGGYTHEPTVKIVDYLKENFTSDAWYMPR